MSSSQVTVLASFRGYKAKKGEFIKLRLNKNYHRSVEKSDYFLLIFEQEIRYLEDFSWRVSSDEESVFLQIKDDELVQEISQIKKVSVGLLAKDYRNLQAQECPYFGYEVYQQKTLLGKVVGYSDSSDLAILEIEVDGKIVLLPEVDEYVEKVGERFLQVRNVQGLLDL